MLKFAKNAVVVLLALTLILATAGCGKKDAGTNAGNIGDAVPLVEEPASSFKYADSDELGYKVDPAGWLISEYIGTNTEVIVPSQIEGKPVVIISNLAFCENDLLVSVTIPDGVTLIGNRAFDKCKSLKSVSIPNGVTKIGNWAFGNCPSLASIVLPNSVTFIGEGAFVNCTSLTSITIPDGVETISDDAFEGCTSLSDESKQRILQLNADSKF